MALRTSVITCSVDASPDRPDKAILCGLPSEEERIDILRVVTRKMELTEDVDLAELAGRTPNYTGADLAALAGEAHLLRVHEILRSKEASRSEALALTQSHFLKALQSVSLSLSAAERSVFRFAARHFLCLFCFDVMASYPLTPHLLCLCVFFVSLLQRKIRKNLRSVPR